MALEKMEALEARITSLVNLVQELKRMNATLHGELRAARERLSKQAELSRRWKDERQDIRVKVEKVLDELDVLDSLEHRKEVALD
jgi:DNA repair ATPase RecN